MRIQQLLTLVLLGNQASASLARRDYVANDYFAIQVESGTDPREISELLGAKYEGPLGELPHHYTFSTPRNHSDRVEENLQLLKARRRRRRDLARRGVVEISQDPKTALETRIKWSQRQELRQRLVKRIPPEPAMRADIKEGDDPAPLDPAQQEAVNRLNTIASTLKIEDPIFKEQWHLFNPLQLGHDLNVTGVWLEGITGNGSVSAVIDDGLDMYSDDLKQNYFAAGSWDFNENSHEPKPLLFDDKHGTRCAGEIAAVRNNVCGVGMAYDSKVAGIRILSKPISDEDEAASINYHYQENHIYSCSWGPPDDGQTMEAPGILIQRAMVNAVQQGRGGLGSIFVFAAGNGAASEDNCNFDGYTNSIYSITVGGIDRQGNHPYYSESCSAQLVVTYSSGGGDAIHTTDVGKDKCVNTHGGTSAAGPLVVGTVALALSARPELSWRDMQYLCIETAIPIHLDDGDWQDTKIGKKFSHVYGYGKIDAYQFVDLAKRWEPVKPQAWFNSPWLSVQHEIPQGDQGLASTFEVTTQMLSAANLERLEHVTVTMNVKHTRRGDLSVELRSPTGVISHIATTRRYDNAHAGYVDWTFMSVAHWGESGVGTWTIIVKDSEVNDQKGTFVDWRLNLWGECINSAVQQLHPIPDEHDDDHDTAKAPVLTTSVRPKPSQSALPTEPTDHPDRPTRPKPSEIKSSTISSLPTTSTEVSVSSSIPAPEATISAAPEATHTSSSSFLPGFFPTFGFSKRTQIWLYGSLGLIILFCVGLGIYVYIQRQKRLRNDPREEYEFQMVGDDDQDDTTRARNDRGTGGYGNNRAKRGGELYDAFAGESDDGIFSDDEEGYRDVHTPPSHDTETSSGSKE